MDNKEPLKYLFTATYKDGRVYEQNARDKSLVEPEKRSCFFDISKDVEECKIASFVLKGDGHEYAVDLTDGHFEVDGIPFFMHEGHLHHIKNPDGSIGKSVMMPLKNFQLLFFRQHTRSYKVALYADMQKEIAHTIAYRMGWRTKSECGHVEERIMQFG